MHGSFIFGIIFQIVQWNRTELKKTCISDRAIAGRDTSRVAIQPEDGIAALAEWWIPVHKLLNLYAACLWLIWPIQNDKKIWWYLSYKSEVQKYLK